MADRSRSGFFRVGHYVFGDNHINRYFLLVGTMILAIDPGTTKSAYVLYNPSTKKIVRMGKEDNHIVLRFLGGVEKRNTFAIEIVKSYGNVMGDSILQTCEWIGRFSQAWKGNVRRVPRKTIVTHLCNNPRAKDKNVRMALIDLYGGKVMAIGNKKQPGPLYGVSTDIWSALALAIYCADNKKPEVNSFLE